MLNRLFQRPKVLPPQRPMVEGRPARMPDGVRLYAVGDVHGRIDLMLELEKMIVEDALRGPANQKFFLVYLGDYVDRGRDSRGVIDYLIMPPPQPFERILLLGNHDAWMRDFIASAAVGPSWLRFGGDATVASYETAIDYSKPDDERIVDVQRRFAAKVSTAHQRFLHELELGFSLGDYFFCHAGIRPGVPLDQQIESDLIWMRDPFLSWNGAAEKVIVHGHTITEQPVMRHNRIGIDTGAFASEILTCLVLEGDTQRFIVTGQLPAA